jgi:hypothetical protein
VRLIVALLACFVSVSAQAAWLKGNLHTHTKESDGDSAPAAVAEWYQRNGYDFLVITDHDKVTRIEAPSGIILIPGEEITDRLAKKPIHVNAIGIEAAIAPRGGSSSAEVISRNVEAVRKGGGVAIVNHPNFGWAFGAEELLQVPGEWLLEIASGHPYVNSDGPPAVESMWDRLLGADRRIWGVAVDDMHHLENPLERDRVTPGKAWVMVRAEKADAKAIVAALARGDFYASTGVELATYTVTGGSIDVRVREQHGARYRILFIGEGGRVLQETLGIGAVYRVTGKERYVRAKVVDSNGRAAWTQPTFVRSQSN